MGNNPQLVRWIASLVVSGLTIAAELLPHGSPAYAAIAGLLGIAGNLGIHVIPSIGQVGSAQSQKSGDGSTKIQAGGNIR